MAKNHDHYLQGTAKEVAMEERIVIDPGICHGQPVIRGTRTPVTVILDLKHAKDHLP